MIKAAIDLDSMVCRCLKNEASFSRRTKTTIAGKKIMIEAADATAFRASMNTITKLLSVHEKMRAI